MSINEQPPDVSTDATAEFFAWVDSLPLDEAIVALEGLKQYEQDIARERFNVEGYIKYET